MYDILFVLNLLLKKTDKVNKYTLHYLFYRETIGIKLLMKMGWKPGHGVGPRLSKKDKSSAKKLHGLKTYGCSLPGQDDKANQDVETSDESEDEEFYRNVTFAPDDFEPFLVKPKIDCFGLGYSGLDRRPVLSSHINLFEPVQPSLVMQEKKKKVSIRGQVRISVCFLCI